MNGFLAMGLFLAVFFLAFWYKFRIYRAILEWKIRDVI